VYAGRIVLLALIAACGSDPPPPDSLRFLRVGVDLEEESAAVLAGLERAGWTLDERIASARFVALSATRGEGGAVRVITERGLQLALPDVGTEEEAARWELDTETTGHDLDGDGIDDVVARVRDADRICATLYAVSADGLVRAVPIAAGERFSDACVEDLVALDGEPPIEAIASSRFFELAHGPVPRLRMPLVLEDGTFVPARAEIRGAFVALERARLGPRVERATSTGDVADAFRLAVELALLAWFDGLGRPAQQQAMDEVLAPLTLNASYEAARERVRAAIERDFRDDERLTE
jgi:hypothetical protein